MKKKMAICIITSLCFSTGCAAYKESDAYTSPETNHQITSSQHVSFVDADAKAISLLLEAEENVVYSPLSYHYAMGMLVTGLDGKSKQEIENYYQLDSETLTNELIQTLQTYQEKDSIILSNSLWLQENASVHKDTLQKISNQYQAYSFLIDLPKEQNQIKEFVKKQTKDKIDLDIETSQDSVLLLINTLAIEDTWITPFTKSPDAAFHGIMDVQTPYLTTTLEMPYYKETDTYQIADILVNQGNRLRIILPKDKDENISESDLQNFMNVKLEPLEMTKLTLQLPPFTIKQHHDISELTAHLGMKSMFENSSDFKKLGDDLIVSSIIQDAMIEVNEDGFSAAASTVVDIAKTSLPIEDLEWKELTMMADHPFLFFVMDENDHILFAGKVNDPTN